MAETIDKNVFCLLLDFIIWFMSHLLTWSSGVYNPYCSHPASQPATYITGSSDYVISAQQVIQDNLPTLYLSDVITKHYIITQ